jgi:hypothetical protein
VEPINLEPNTLQKTAYCDLRQMVEMPFVVTAGRRIFIPNADFIITEWEGI